MENAESEGDVPDHKQMITIIVIRCIFPFGLLARYPAAVSGDATTHSGYQRNKRRSSTLDRQGAHDCNFVIVWLRPSHERRNIGRECTAGLHVCRSFVILLIRCSCGIPTFFCVLPSEYRPCCQHFSNRNALSQKKKTNESGEGASLPKGSIGWKLRNRWVAPQLLSNFSFNPFNRNNNRPKFMSANAFRHSNLRENLNVKKNRWLHLHT